MKTTNLLLALIAILVGGIGLILWRNSRTEEARRQAIHRQINEDRAKAKAQAEALANSQREAQTMADIQRTESETKHASEDLRLEKAKQAMDKIGTGEAPLQQPANPGSS